MKEDVNELWRKELLLRFPDWQSEEAVRRWPAMKNVLRIGDSVCGEVIARAPFGVWMDIGVGYPALLLVVNMRDAKSRRLSMDDYPAVGDKIDCQINALGDSGEIGLKQSA